MSAPSVTTNYVHPTGPRRCTTAEDRERSLVRTYAEGLVDHAEKGLGGGARAVYGLLDRVTAEANAIIRERGLK